MAEATTGTISVQCSCGKKLKAPASAVGKKAKCPKCGNVLTVAPPPPVDEDNSLDALYDLAQESEQHAAQQQMAPRCPGCMREMAQGAVICTNCGYDTRKGKAIAPKVEATRFDAAAAAANVASGRTAKKVVDKMAPQGSFVKGLLASGGGAMAGAFVWVLIAWATGYWGMLPVFLVAIGAGFGMQWGQEGYSYAGGSAAAAITFVVTILARIAVVIALVVPHMVSDQLKSAKQKEEERMPDLSQYDERVVDKLLMEQQKLQKPAAAKPAPAPPVASSDDEESEDEEDSEPVDLEEVALYQAVEKKLQAMPKAEYDALVKKYDDQEKAEMLEYYVTEDILKMVIGVHPSRASSTEHDQAEKAAKEKIAKMTPAQRDAEYKRLNAQKEKENAEMIAAAKKAREERAAARGRTVEEEESTARGAVAAIGAIVIFFLIFNGFGGVLAFILALGLAYRTASGSVSST